MSIKVYELRHTEYAWESCETHVSTLIFETKEDACEYIELLKPDIIDQYCYEYSLESNIGALERYVKDTEDDTYNALTNNYDYFYVEIEEYGYDELLITEKEILKFK